MPSTYSAETLSRKQLRQKLRNKRKALPLRAQIRAAQKLCFRLLKLPCIKQAESLAFYFASDGEINPSHFMQHCLKKGKSCYLPVISTQSKKHEMHFSPYKLGNGLKPNRYGILEPKKTAHTKNAHDIDIVLLPLVGFDRGGNRLGMGAGYYDRALANPPKRYNRKIRYIGLAHSLQEVHTLKRQDWDIPLHAIVTEKETFLIRNT